MLPVNYYSHHIGDYAKKTGHLSLAEHGAYLQMLQLYYGTEAPLPTGRALYRLLRADSAAERKAIDVVVRQFWTITEGGLTNLRALEEMAAYRHFIDVQQAKGRAGADARWHRNGHAPATSNGHAPAMAEGMAEGMAARWPPTSTSTSNPNPNPTPTPNPEGVGGRKRFRTADEIEAEERARAER